MSTVGPRSNWVRKLVFGLGLMVIGCFALFSAASAEEATTLPPPPPPVIELAGTIGVLGATDCQVWTLQAAAAATNVHPATFEILNPSPEMQQLGLRVVVHAQVQTAPGPNSCMVGLMLPKLLVLSWHVLPPPPTFTPTRTPGENHPTATPTRTPGENHPTATPTRTPGENHPTATPTRTERPHPTATPTVTPGGPPSGGMPITLLGTITQLQGTSCSVWALRSAPFAPSAPGSNIRGATFEILNATTEIEQEGLLVEVHGLVYFQYPPDPCVAGAALPKLWILEWAIPNTPTPTPAGGPPPGGVPIVVAGKVTVLGATDCATWVLQSLEPRDSNKVATFELLNPTPEIEQDGLLVQVHGLVYFQFPPNPCFPDAHLVKLWIGEWHPLPPPPTPTSRPTEPPRPTPTVTPTFPPPPPTPTPNPNIIIVDNRDAGFSVTGTWGTSDYSGQKWGADYRYTPCYPGNPATASWVADLPQAGIYQVSAWYTAGANRTEAAPYIIHIGAATQEVVLNQQTNGGRWNVLGNFYFDSGSSTVDLSADSLRFYAIADAVRFDLITTKPETIIDNDSPDCIHTSGWIEEASQEGFYGDNYLVTGLDAGSQVAQWQFAAPACGFWEVSAWYPKDEVEAASPALYRISTAEESAVKALNQRENGGEWNALGVYYLTSDATLAVRLSNILPSATTDPGSRLYADAIRLRYVTPDVRLVVDNQSSGFQLNGSWPQGSAPGGFQTTYRYHAAASGTSKAVWRYAVKVPGTYQVAVWFPGGTNRAPNARYIIGTANGELSMTVDQRRNRADWLILGNYFLPIGPVYVRLDAAASTGYVIADAARFQFVAAAVDDQVVDNGEAGYAEVGTWQTGESPQAYGADYRFKLFGDGSASATWNADALSRYAIAVRFPSSADNAPDALYQVVSPLMSPVAMAYHVNQRVGGGQWQTLNFMRIAGPASGIALTDAATAGNVVADAARFTKVAP